MTNVIVVVVAALLASTDALGAVPARIDAAAPRPGDGAAASSDATGAASDAKATAGAPDQGELVSASAERTSTSDAPIRDGSAVAPAGGTASSDAPHRDDTAVAPVKGTETPPAPAAETVDVPAPEETAAPDGGVSAPSGAVESEWNGTLAGPEVAPAPAPDRGDARVRRFLGALLGGAVGVGVPIALAPAFPCTTGFGGTSSCLSTGHLALAFASPLLGLVGSVAGYVAAGGQASAAGLGALFPAALTTMAVMVAMTQMDPTLVRSWLPGVIAGASVLALTSALFLTWREDQVASASAAAGVDAGAGRVRVAATVAASTAIAVAGATAAIGGALACRGGCSGTVAVAISSVLLVGHAFAVFGVHRALGGRAPAWAPLLSLVVDGLGFGLLMAAVWLPTSSTSGFSEGARNNLAAFTAGAAIVTGLSVTPMLILEALHTRAVEAEAASRVRVGVAPMPGGGVVSAGLSW